MTNIQIPMSKEISNHKVVKLDILVLTLIGHWSFEFGI